MQQMKSFQSTDLYDSMVDGGVLLLPQHYEGDNDDGSDHDSSYH